MTTMKIGRYASNAEAIPAPETPTANNSTGSQQQLDAMSAETIVPILAINSPRLEEGFEDVVVAPGNVFAVVVQQLATGNDRRSKSLDME